jgi:hypothetical protein
MAKYHCQVGHVTATDCALDNDKDTHPTNGYMCPVEQWTSDWSHGVKLLLRMHAHTYICHAVLHLDARPGGPRGEALPHGVLQLSDEHLLEALGAEELRGEAPDELVDGAAVRGDALLAEDVVGRLRVPEPEQLALLLENEPVELRVQGDHQRLPHQVGLEHRTIPEEQQCIVDMNSSKVISLIVQNSKQYESSNKFRVTWAALMLVVTA